MAYKLKESGADLRIVWFDYGQRHVRERQFSRACAEALGAQWSPIDLSGLGPLIGGSSLTDLTIDVPEGHYAAENMRITVVPNRNAIMLAIAWGIAVADHADYVAIAAHGGDHFIYPDCRPEFFAAFDRAEQLANDGFALTRLLTPFSTMTKADIVSEGARLGVPFDQTYSCYRGGERHCGKCGTCVERREAFLLAGVEDPTEYEAQS